MPTEEEICVSLIPHELQTRTCILAHLQLVWSDPNELNHCPEKSNLTRDGKGDIAGVKD